MLRHGLIVSVFVLIGCASAGADMGDGDDDSSQGGGGGSSGTHAAGSTSGPASGGKGAAGGTGGTTSLAGRSATGGSSQAGEAQGGGKGGTSGGTAAAAGAAVATHTNPLSKDLIAEFVAAHNAARSQTDLNPPPSPALPLVSWDPILADSAYNYLSQCEVTTAEVDHNKDRTSDYQALGGTDSYVGENIYATTGTTVAPADAVDAWMSEASVYDYAKNNVSAAGHYTQVVWRTSVRIGCAIVNCPNARYNNTVLCDYAPGGNIVGQKPY